MINLLQIHEPGETPMPHEGDEVAVGIDLGTTNSLVAISHDEVPQVIHDENDKFIVPSVLSVAENGFEIGKVSENSLSSIKRLMGLGYKEAENIIADFGFDVDKENSKKIIRLKLNGKEFTPVEISAEILKKLKKNAEKALERKVTKAVITVPAYFNDSQRAATKDAAKLANIEVLRLINEPTAAALAYGLDKGAEGTFAIYDLGGGTFDVSILKMQMGVFKVVATGGDTLLGGDDFDFLLAEYIKTKFNLEASLSELKSLARQVKEDLTYNDIAKEKFKNTEIEITKSEFEQAIGYLADKTITIFEGVLKDAKLLHNKLDGVVLVGGSTRIPLIRKKIEQLTGKLPLSDIDPDKVVAMGAAIQAEALTKGSNNLLLDVTPLSLGLETYGGLMEVLVQRNTPIPVSASQKFTTYEDGQTGMSIHVLQGERELAADCRSLARFELKNIPPMQAGTAVIEVTFMLDADGILTVAAKEETTGTHAEIEVKPSYGLDADEMEKILVTSMETAKNDIMARLLQESRVEADIVIKTLESALKNDGNLIANEYKDRIYKQVEVLKAAMAGTNRDLIDIEVKNLDAVAQDFADARVNEALKGYLTGKKVNEF